MRFTHNINQLSIIKQFKRLTFYYVDYVGLQKYYTCFTNDSRVNQRQVISLEIFFLFFIGSSFVSTFQSRTGNSNGYTWQGKLSTE